MEKLGVVTEIVSVTETSGKVSAVRDSICPVCETHLPAPETANVKCCVNCGTKPFEKK